MNRIIKFRVFYERKFHYPDFYAFDGDNDDGKYMLWNWKDGDFCKTSSNFQQSTNLKDRNGKEIYEGDIIEFIVPKDNGTLALVEWVEEAPRFLLKDINKDGFGGWEFHNGMTNQIKIIGNIFETPELVNFAQNGKKET